MPDKSDPFKASAREQQPGEFDQDMADEFDIGSIVRVKHLPAAKTDHPVAETNDDYLMGRSKHETERLQKQGLLYNPFTRALLEQAGLKPGMRVLDVGCGAGDVSLIAGAIVGADGSVTGVDRDRGVLETARFRAMAMPHITFRQTDLDAPEIDGEFDAVIGRLVLIYLRDPVATLRRLRPHLGPSGIVVFQELDWGIGPLCNVPSPLLDRIWAWAIEMFRRAGRDGRVGTNLRRIFLETGLSEPVMSLHAPLGGGDDFAGYQYMEDSVRSGLPNVVRLGVASAEEVEIDTLGERLRQEIASQNGVFALPPLVGAWARSG